jgi:hypothetical protein
MQNYDQLLLWTHMKVFYAYYLKQRSIDYICTKFHKIFFSGIQVKRGDSQMHRQQGEYIRLLSFF